MSTCPPDHKHAETGTCYVIHKCRCNDCRRASSARERQRRKLKAYGRYGTGLVDAAPAREHLLMLRDFGMGYKTIARVAGVGVTAARTLLYGREDYQGGVKGPRHGEVKKRISRETAERLLAVEPKLEYLGERVTVPAKPYVRRLRALVALGWSQSKLAARLGMHDTNFSKVFAARRMRSVTALKVVALYDELWDTLPPRDQWRDRIAYSRSVKYAQERGWPLPMDWEAVDSNFDRMYPVRRSAA